MAFTSFNFLVFVAATVLVYYVAPRKFRWLVLLAASYTFYLMSSPKTFVFILLTTVITFLGGIQIDKANQECREYIDAHKDSLSRDEKKAIKEQYKHSKKKHAAIVLIADFGILAILKYFRYYIEAMGIPGLSAMTGSLLIPLGISFYTFQSAAYIIDIYRDKIRADRNIVKFALFTSFFPQIIQGPIARYDHLANQLYEGHSFEYNNLAHGAQLMLWGFFKKLVIADRVAIMVSAVFDNYQDYQGWAVFAALIGYTIQIYGDFSGGIDIARGVARCMGIDMGHNFKRPYFSDSLSEFWRRWHMSLSFWCRDYIFFSISLSKTFGKMGKSLRKVLGDRVGKLFPVLCAQMATFITIGLWHGAEFKYVAYGLYNGIVIISGLLLEPYFKKWIEALHINIESKGWKLFQILRTMLIVICGRVFPKAASFTVALSMFASIFKFSNKLGIKDTIHAMGLTKYDYIVLFVGCLIWFCVSLIEEREERLARAGEETGGSIVAGKATGVVSTIVETGAEFRNALDKKPLPVRWAVYIVAVMAVIIFGVYGVGYDASTFIYRGF